MPNSKEIWELILKALDEKSQLGLLTYLRRCTSYEFEDDLLLIKAANQQDSDYLSRAAVQQQIRLIASQYVSIRAIKIYQD